MMKTRMTCLVSDGAVGVTGADGAGDNGAADAETSGPRHLQTGLPLSKYKVTPDKADSRNKAAAVSGHSRASRGRTFYGLP